MFFARIVSLETKMPSLCHALLGPDVVGILRQPLGKIDYVWAKRNGRSIDRLRLVTHPNILRDETWVDSSETGRNDIHS